MTVPAPDIRLQRFKQQDAQELFRVINACRDYLSQWLPWVKYTRVPEDIRNFIASFEYTDLYTGRELYKIQLQGRLVGMIDIHNGNREQRSADLGYWLSKDAQHKGIMTAACTKLIDHAFTALGLERLNIKCASGNLRSQQIAQRLGFSHVGLDDKPQFIEGKYWDLLVYSISKEEWQSRQTATSHGHTPSRIL